MCSIAKIFKRPFHLKGWYRARRTKIKAVYKDEVFKTIQRPDRGGVINFLYLAEPCVPQTSIRTPR